MKKKRKIHKGGRPRRRPDRTDPTPETAAKLQPNVLTTLLHDSIITGEQHAAAEEIAGVWQALSRSLTARSAAADLIRHSGQSPDPFGLMNSDEIWRWQKRYKPWANGQSKKIVSRRPPLCRFRLTLKVAADNMWPLLVSVRHQVPLGATVNALRDALDAYIVVKK